MAVLGILLEIGYFHTSTQVPVANLTIDTHRALAPIALYKLPRQASEIATQVPGVKEHIASIDHLSATLTNKTNQLSHAITNGLADAFNRDVQGVNGKNDSTTFPGDVSDVLTNLEHAYWYAKFLSNRYQLLQYRYRAFNTSAAAEFRFLEPSDWKKYAITSGCEFCALMGFNFTEIWWSP